MELHAFKHSIVKILQEGQRLQEVDITGKHTTGRRGKQTQLVTYFSAASLCWLLPKGISDNFAEYAIAFLGIFVGLFTSIIISLYDKSQHLYVDFDKKPNEEKARVHMRRNYIVQFTGLTAYSIVLAVIAVALLLGILLFPDMHLNLSTYHLISSWQQLNGQTLLNLFAATATVIFRFTAFCLLINFFWVTIFALSSYFSYLLSEYKKLGISPGK